MELEPVERAHQRANGGDGIAYVAGELELVRGLRLTVHQPVDHLQGECNVQEEVAEGVVQAPEGGKRPPRAVEQNLCVVDHVPKGEEEDEDVVVVDGIDGRDWRDGRVYEARHEQVVHECVALGPNSIEKIWLEFWLEKPLEVWLEMSYTKKMFKNG